MTNDVSDLQLNKRIDTQVNKELRTVGRDPKASWRGVRTAMLAAANTLRDIAGEHQLPVGLEETKRLRRIYCETRFQSNDTRIDAVLVPTNQGFILRLREGQHKVRARFSTAHEIGHTFFYDIGKSPPVRLVTNATGVSRREEEICSAFARELLMPRDSVASSIGGLRSKDGPRMLLYLGLRYDVSPEVVARRLLHDMSLFPTVLVFLKETQDVGRETLHSRVGGPYKGSEIKFLRKQEKELYGKVRRIVEGTPPYNELDNLDHLYSDIVSLQWRHDTRDSGSRLIVWLNFKRNRSQFG